MPVPGSTVRRANDVNHYYQPQKFIWWYEAAIDWMIANPGRPLKELATHLGQSYQTILYMQSSDVFQHRLAERRQQVADELNTEILARTGRVAVTGLKILEERLQKEAEGQRKESPLLTISEVTQKSLAALGYGPQKGSGVTIVNQANASVDVGASRQAIEMAREQIRREQAQRSRSEAIDAEFEELPLPPEGEQPDLFSQEEPLPAAAAREPDVLDVDPLDELFDVGGDGPHVEQGEG